MMRLLLIGSVFSLTFLVGAATAPAQVDVQIRLEKRELIAGEPVVAVVTIANRAGRDLSFSGTKQMSWLDFVVKDSRDQPVAVIGRPTFGSVTIGAGQSVARRMEISRLFRLSELGSYAVTAVVREPDDARDAYLSNRMTFNVTTGRPLWSQKIGMGATDDVREYRLLSFNNGSKTEIYVQLADDQLGIPLKTFSLGEALMFRQPQVAVDGERNLHVLHLVGPAMWMQTSITPEGAVTARNMHKRSASDPRLVTFGSGEVQVQGGIPFDPEAEAAARARVRNLSDRPN